jgi:hypothetical protein
MLEPCPWCGQDRPLTEEILASVVCLQCAADYYAECQGEVDRDE